jgi:hypothetical protein
VAPLFIVISARLNGFCGLRVLDLMLGEREGERELFVPSHSIHASIAAREREAKKLKKVVVTADTMVEARRTVTRYRPSVIFEADDTMERLGYTL